MMMMMMMMMMRMMMRMNITISPLSNLFSPSRVHLSFAFQKNALAIRMLYSIEHIFPRGKIFTECDVHHKSENINESVRFKRKDINDKSEDINEKFPHRPPPPPPTALVSHLITPFVTLRRGRGCINCH